MPLFTPQVLVGTFLASLREIKRKAARVSPRKKRVFFWVWASKNLARLTLTRAQADMNDSDTQDTTSQNALDIALTPGVVMDTNITLTGELFRTTPSSWFSPADPSPCSVYRVVLCEHQAILERYSQRDDHECIHRSRVPDTL